MNNSHGETSARQATTTAAEEPVSVLCVDDNPHVGESLRLKFERSGGFTWSGWLSSADALVSTVKLVCPKIVILETDVPGRSPFEALVELGAQCPGTRAVMFSNQVRFELIDRSMEAGAWGYVSKSDGEDALVQAVREVMANELALSPEVRAAYERTPHRTHEALLKSATLPPSDGVMIKVLCVDDNRDLVEMLRAIINCESDMTALEGVYEGAGLIEAAARLRPHVAVVDLTMPGEITPIEAIRRAIRATPDLRIVAYSGYDDQRTVNEAMEAGAWGFVSKHAEPTALVDAVRKIAGGKVAF